MLTTIENLEVYTGKTITASEDEAIYTSLINSVSAEIEKLCNRHFNSDSYDETYDIDGNSINLKQYPIISITSVEYGSPFDASNRTALDADQYFTYDDEGIVSLSLRFNRASQWVNVVYNAGYVTLPDDLVQIANKWVENQFNNTSVNSSIKKEKLGDYSIEFSSVEDTIEQMKVDLSKWIKCV